MKIVLGVIVIAAAVILGAWLSIWIMLYGGIMQAIENFGVDNSAVVWGIIRAVFFSLGAIPGYVLGLIGYGIAIS